MVEMRDLNNTLQTQIKIIEDLAPDLEAGTYLAGGVAVALYCHHRVSLDIDLFVPHEFDPAAVFERIGQHNNDAVVTSTSAGTLHLEVKHVPVSILAYRYPLLGNVDKMPNVPVPVASTEDLLCMKLAAISGRGAAKDFWDVDELLNLRGKEDDLMEAIALFRKKFPSHDPGHVTKALTYFGDADAAPLPAGLTPLHWTQLKNSFRRRVLAL